jgi:hypothetical protein
MRANQQLMLRIAETQTQLTPALQRIATISDGGGQTHLRNIETLLQRLLTESEQGRSHSTSELRNEIRVLTRTLAAIAEQPRA